MSSVLVVYGTGTGCTAGVAEKIGESLAAHGVEVTVAPAADKPDAAAFDAVIVGSGIRAGAWHKPVAEWVRGNADALKQRPVAFFTACLTLAAEPEKTDEVRAYTDTLIAETGVEPAAYGLFAGWNEPKKFSFIERTILKMMKAPEGDFRDFAAIGEWADEAAERLVAAG